MFKKFNILFTQQRKSISDLETNLYLTYRVTCSVQKNNIILHDTECNELLSKKKLELENNQLNQHLLVFNVPNLYMLLKKTYIQFDLKCSKKRDIFFLCTWGINICKIFWDVRCKAELVQQGIHSSTALFNIAQCSKMISNNTVHFTERLYLQKVQTGQKYCRINPKPHYPLTYYQTQFKEHWLSLKSIIWNRIHFGLFIL